MKLEELLEAAKPEEYPKEIVKQYNKLKKSIGDFLDFKFDKTSKRDGYGSGRNFQTYVSNGRMDIEDISTSLNMTEEFSTAKVVLSIKYPTKGSDEALKQFEIIVKRLDGDKPENSTWYGEGENSTYWTFYLGKMPEDLESKPKAKYNPEKEYQARRNTTQQSNDRARANHQFSNSIGGDSSNYR